jgi:hypothetical protein
MFIFFLGFISVVEMAVGCALLALLFRPLQKVGLPVIHKKVLFVVLGVLLISPIVAPAGSITLIPLPVCVLIAFIRSMSDIMFLFRAWWFVVPSILVTGFVCWCLASKIFLTPTAE